MGDFMRLVTGMLLLACSSSAMAADQCIRSLPDHRQGHWHYRYQDGAKCWYGPGAESIRLSRREDREQLEPRRHREPERTAPPTPVASIAQYIEEEPDQPLDPTVKRVRVEPFRMPLSSSRRIQQTFEQLVDACQLSIEACERFVGR
jgi:hypothetical protein